MARLSTSRIILPPLPTTPPHPPPPPPPIPATTPRNPQWHKHRAGPGKLLQDFTANRCGTGRQIRVGCVVQKMPPRLPAVLRRQPERRRRIAVLALRDGRPEGPDASSLYRIAVRRQKNPGLDTKVFGRRSHCRSVIPSAASHDFLYRPVFQSLRQRPKSAPHPERSRW